MTDRTIDSRDSKAPINDFMQRHPQDLPDICCDHALCWLHIYSLIFLFLVTIQTMLSERLSGLPAGWLRYPCRLRVPQARRPGGHLQGGQRRRISTTQSIEGYFSIHNSSLNKLLCSHSLLLIL